MASRSRQRGTTKKDNKNKRNTSKSKRKKLVNKKNIQTQIIEKEGGVMGCINPRDIPDISPPWTYKQLDKKKLSALKNLASQYKIKYGVRTKKKTLINKLLEIEAIVEVDKKVDTKEADDDEMKKIVLENETARPGLLYVY